MFVGCFLLHPWKITVNAIGLPALSGWRPPLVTNSKNLKQQKQN